MFLFLLNHDLAARLGADLRRVSARAVSRRVVDAVLAWPDADGQVACQLREDDVMQLRRWLERRQPTYAPAVLSRLDEGVHC